jgi:hypothetical protein
MQAYYDGEFGEPGSDEAKASRNYLMADSIAKFVRNTGKDIGNIGAQFTGGAINNNMEQTAWDKAQQKMVDPQWQAEQKSRELANISSQFKNNISKLRGETGAKVLTLIKGQPKTVQIALMGIANKLMSGQELSAADYVVSGANELIQAIK